VKVFEQLPFETTDEKFKICQKLENTLEVDYNICRNLSIVEKGNNVCLWRVS
jgi:hypothetical protein